MYGLEPGQRCLDGAGIHKNRRADVHHEVSLIATVAVSFVFAAVCGYLADRLRLPPLVGYLVAGILMGPFTPGFIADAALASQLAEMGVILLMFGVGLHFSASELLAVRGIAVPGAVAQIVLATLLGVGLASLWGWGIGAGLVLGLSLSVASTVVLLKALEERNLVNSANGRVAVGWLIVEDLAMVLALVLLPALAEILGAHAGGAAGQAAAGGMPLVLTIAITLLKVGAFAVMAIFLGPKVVPWLLTLVARTGSQELFTLSVLAIALGIAFGATEIFGVSFALGAFFAGVVMSESNLSHRAAADSLPLQNAFSVLFFISVGMLFDPSILLREPMAVLGALALIIFGKSLIAFCIVLLLRFPVGMGLTVAASLAQIGEFSFILAELGVGLGMLPQEGRDLILGGAILSILLNPVVFAGVGYLKPWLEKRSASATEASPETTVVEEPDVEELQPTTLTNHAVLIGYGRVGSLVGDALKEVGKPFLVIEDADKTVAKLRDDDVETIVGNAANGDVLAAANLAEARQLIIAIPNAFEAGQIVVKARAANPAISILARAHSDAEVQHLQDLGADAVIMGEREIARGIVAHILDLDKPKPEEPLSA